MRPRHNASNSRGLHTTTPQGISLWCAVRLMWPGRGKNTSENSLTCRLQSFVVGRGGLQIEPHVLDSPLVPNPPPCEPPSPKTQGPPLSMVLADWGGVFGMPHLYLFALLHSLSHCVTSNGLSHLVSNLERYVGNNMNALPAY